MEGVGAMNLTTSNYTDRITLATGLAEKVAEQLSAAIAEKGVATLVVPGGKTPGAFLEILSLADIEWSKVRVTVTDERWEPMDSPRSNYGLLRSTLLQNRAASAKLISLYREFDKPEDVADEINADVQDMLPIDVCVLGMGNDGHTASLFPDADCLALALSEDCPNAILMVDSESAGEPRVTLTARVLKNSGKVHLLISGQDKSDTLDRISNDQSNDPLPVGAVLNGISAEVHYAP